MNPRVSVLGLAVTAVAVLGCAGVPARREVFRLPASYNFAFYNTYNMAARSFYAAHYAHFGVYETGLTKGENNREAFEKLYRTVLHYLDEPPTFEPPAVIIAPKWSKIAFKTGQSMDWTHMLHSQLYDILTDDRVEDKQSVGERAIAYYLSESDMAFSTRPYGHAFMECGGTWAGTFRRKYPEINGILWGYHWHHAAVYEALMEPDPAVRGRNLERVIRTFRDSVLADPPQRMPLTREVAPKFAAMFPAGAYIFDNLHMMHDVVNDIMVDERIPDKAFEIEKLRRLMVYTNQDFVVPPAMPMGHGGAADEAHGMDEEHRMEVDPRMDMGDARAQTPDEMCRPAMQMPMQGGGR